MTSLPEIKSRALYTRLLRYARPYWRMFALALLAMIVASATEPALPALLKIIFDEGFVAKDVTIIQLAPLVLVGLFLLRGFAGFVSAYAIAWVGSRVVADIRQQMFRRLLDLPIPFFERHATGTLVSKFNHDVSQVAAAASSVITVLVRETLTMIGLLAWLLYLNWQLTLIALVVAPPIALITRAAANRIRALSRHTQQTMGEMTQVLEEAIGGRKVVKIFGGQQYEESRFVRAADRVRSLGMKLTTVSALSTPAVQMFVSIALALIIYFAALQSMRDETTVGGFVSFITAMVMLLNPIRALTGVNEAIQRGLAAAESIFGLLDQQPENDAGTRQLTRARGRIELCDVSFRYQADGAPALDRISMIAEPGERVALVGKSGSGKTTLANLIARFYAPDAGSILIDDVPIDALQLSALRANIAIVSQDVVLFDDTVSANIAYGRSGDIAPAVIEAAARAASAHEFIVALPEGYATVIGENGLRLSGGQRQRIAIARALLKDAPILILDEATSALDNESERQVQAALEELMKHRTTLVIAHRLSTIERADRIVVLEKGRIVESGRHADLLAANGVYARLHALQFRETAAITNDQ
ncbi:MAG: lipid A export permease/ATP-binding protein MsbA [Rhodocyclaceae bacterium]|nr:lipid A export permease/ATP-binding protein MsbA [Rhodocyclaceae bacterium]